MSDSFDVLLRGTRNFRFTGNNHEIGYIYYLDNRQKIHMSMAIPRVRADFVVDLAKDGSVVGIECMHPTNKPGPVLRWMKKSMREEFILLYSIWLDLMKTLSRRS